MTSSIKVRSHNHPVLVTVCDEIDGNRAVASQEVCLWPEDGERAFYTTTTRFLRIIDLSYDEAAERGFVRPQPAADQGGEDPAT